MARESKQKRSIKPAENSRQPQQSASGAVTADDIRRLVAKLKGEEAKK